VGWGPFDIYKNLVGDNIRSIINDISTKPLENHNSLIGNIPININKEGKDNYKWTVLKEVSSIKEKGNGHFELRGEEIHFLTNSGGDFKVLINDRGEVEIKGATVDPTNNELTEEGLDNAIKSYLFDNEGFDEEETGDLIDEGLKALDVLSDQERNGKILSKKEYLIESIKEGKENIIKSLLQNLSDKLNEGEEEKYKEEFLDKLVNKLLNC